MKRRNFLSLLAASLTLDPEKLLWTPGTKLISIPKPNSKILIQELIQRRMDEAVLEFHREITEHLMFSCTQGTGYFHPIYPALASGGTFIQEPFIYPIYGKLPLA